MEYLVHFVTLKLMTDADQIWCLVCTLKCVWQIWFRYWLSDKTLISNYHIDSNLSVAHVFKIFSLFMNSDRHSHEYNSPTQNPGLPRLNPVYVLKFFCLKTIIIIIINNLTSRSSNSLHMFLLMILQFLMSHELALIPTYPVLYDLFTLITLGGIL